jgi:apolipoprotein N-acyltransferase
MFKWLKRFFLCAILVFVCLFTLVFSVENSQVISPVFFGIPLASLSVGLWMTVSLLFGALVGLLISVLPVYLGRYSLLYKDKKIQRLEKELSILRLATLKNK